MANYNYDEAGNMAAYFLLTFLSIILIPLTISSLTPSKSEHLRAHCALQATDRTVQSHE